VLVLAVFAVGLVVPSASSAALLNIHVYDDFYSPDNAQDASFQFLDIDNPNIEFDWGDFNGDTTSANHDVQQVKGMFKSGDPKKTGKYELQASGGTYKYLCTVHQGMKGSFGIIPDLNLISETQARLTWANKFTETGKAFDVRYRVNAGKWKLWQKHTKKFRGTFGKNSKPVAADFEHHAYDFEARTYKGKKSKKKRSGWSPAASVSP
jgi:hypothetical protein